MKKITKSLMVLGLLAMGVTNASAWTSIINNGNFEGEGNTNFFVKQAAVGGNVQTAAIIEGIGAPDATGTLTHGIRLQSAEGATQEWDTQFFIKFDKKIPAGTTLKISFDYKAAVKETAHTQSHALPSDYIHWACIGDVNFTTEWQHFSTELTVSSDMSTSSKAFQSIAFNLAVGNQYNDFYFDNFVVEVDDEVYETLADADEYTAGEQTVLDIQEIVEKVWKSVINNGDLEGEGNTNFFVKQAAVGADVQTAAIVAGAGNEGSKGVVIQSADDPTEAWDSQFWIKFDKKIPAGTKLRVKFDYKATSNASADTQSHGLPGNYNHWACIGSVSFTPAWQTYDTEITVSADMSKTDNPFQSIAFNLASGQFNNFYFDNFVVEVPEDVYDTLDDSVFPEGETPAEQEVLPEVQTIKVTIGNEGATTFSFKKPLELVDGLKAYAIVLNEGGWADKIEIEGSLAANTPVVLEGEANEYALTVAESGNAPTANDLLISDGTVKGAANIFALAAGAKGVGFYVVGSDVTIPKGKGYLSVPVSVDGTEVEPEPVGVRDFIPFGGDATGISAVAAAQNDNVIFNLAGQRVVKAQKGLYIMNGKKVLVK